MIKKTSCIQVTSLVILNLWADDYYIIHQTQMWGNDYYIVH
jgi:hypothetical protein